MRRDIITRAMIKEFQDYLWEHEKAKLTIQKYISEIENLKEFLQGQPIEKSRLLEYRGQLQERHKARTVNAKLSAVNAYLVFSGMEDCKVKLLKIQHCSFIEENKELSEAEYRRLLSSAGKLKNKRMYYLLLTFGGTGIRVSELPFITVEAVRTGRADINLKGKNRTVILPKKLTDKLSRYAKEQGIRTGAVFCTSSGKKLDRSNICHDMKKLCNEANVDVHKVFPHNFRHLFARCFYAVHKNLAHLADILGHSSVETTRIYVQTSIREHERIISKMKLGV